jgi:hypothetical protein
LVIAIYLYWQVPILLWIYLGAIIALLIDSISVLYRRQKSIFNELLTFAAVCLVAPFAAIATTGTATISLFGLSLLNTLFFSSAIFTVKLRKTKSVSLIPSLVYHGVATSNDFWFVVCWVVDYAGGDRFWCSAGQVWDHSLAIRMV